MVRHMCGGPQEKGMPRSGLPNEDELASEGDGRGRRWETEQGQPVRPEGPGLRGPRAALWQANRKPGGLDAEKAVAGIPGVGGPFQRRTCHQRDRRSARAPHPEAGAGASWEREGELDHCSVRSPQRPLLTAALLPCPGMSVHLRGASSAGSLAQDSHPAVPGALVSPTRTGPSPRPTPGSTADPRGAGPTWPHLLPAGVQGPGY